jgi:DNA polymerase-3 subunit alpha
MEALVKSGAFDETHPDGKAGRAQLVAAIDIAVRMAEEAAANADQVGLFGEDTAVGSAGSVATLPVVPPYSARDTLLEEKLALGYCFSGSLFDNVAHEVRRFAATPLSRTMPTKDPIWIAGVVTNSRAQMTRRGMMRVIELDDGSGRMEVTVFNELYDARKHVLKVDDVLIISAKIDNDEYSGGLRASAVEIVTLTEARTRFGCVLRLSVDRAELPDDFQAWLQNLKKALLHPFPAGQGSGQSSARVAAKETVVILQLQDSGQQVQIKLGPHFRLNPSDEVITGLQQTLGSGVTLALAYDS